MLIIAIEIDFLQTMNGTAIGTAPDSELLILKPSDITGEGKDFGRAIGINPVMTNVTGESMRLGI